MEFAISSVPEPSFSATPTLPVSHLTPSYVSELNLAVVPSFKVSNVYAQTLFPKTVDLKTTSFATKSPVVLNILSPPLAVEAVEKSSRLSEADIELGVPSYILVSFSESASSSDVVGELFVAVYVSAYAGRKPAASIVKAARAVYFCCLFIIIFPLQKRNYFNFCTPHIAPPPSPKSRQK